MSKSTVHLKCSCLNEKGEICRKALISLNGDLTLFRINKKNACIRLCIAKADMSVLSCQMMLAHCFGLISEVTYLANE